MLGTYSGAVGSMFCAGGNGRVILSDTANSYSGKTTIQPGTLEVLSIANWCPTPISSGLGAPATLANGTIDIGSGTPAVALQYTSPGHATNRVVNLAGTTGGATLDVGGSGAIEFTAASTATGAGVKTLTLTGTSMADNRVGVIMNGSGATLSRSTRRARAAGCSRRRQVRTPGRPASSGASWS